MTSSVDWFDGEEGLRLWAIESAEMRKALPVDPAGDSLIIGPSACAHNPFDNYVFGQTWYFDPVAGRDNPWISDNVSSLPIQDECMDLVILRHCMHTDETARHLLFDACRVLKPGGHIILSCLNMRGWIARGVLRGKNPPRLSASWIKTVSQQTALSIEYFRSFGFGGVENRYAARTLPPVFAGLSNLHICVLAKQPAGGEIRRLVFKLPKRGRSVAASTGIYSKTGT